MNISTMACNISWCSNRYYFRFFRVNNIFNRYFYIISPRIRLKQTFVFNRYIHICVSSRWCIFRNCISPLILPNARRYFKENCSVSTTINILAVWLHKTFVNPVNRRVWLSSYDGMNISTVACTISWCSNWYYFRLITYVICWYNCFITQQKEESNNI